MGFGVLPKDTLTCGVKESGAECLTCTCDRLLIAGRKLSRYRNIDTALIYELCDINSGLKLSGFVRQIVTISSKNGSLGSFLGLVCVFLGYDGCSGLDIAPTLPDDGACGVPEASRAQCGCDHGPDAPYF